MKFGRPATGQTRVSKMFPLPLARCSGMVKADLSARSVRRVGRLAQCLWKSCIPVVRIPALSSLVEFFISSTIFALARASGLEDRETSIE